VDIVLVNPQPMANSPFTEGEKLPPLGLAYLAAVLRKNGYEVSIIDNYLERIPEDNVIKKIKRYNPSMVGLTCTSTTYLSSLHLAKKVKEEMAIPIIFGGPHPTVLRERILQHPFVDFIVIGEGEHTLLELVGKILTRDDKRDIKGIMHRKANDTVFTGSRPFIQNLDSLPHPALELLPMAKYPRTEVCSRKPALSINTSRGCTFNCSFCSVHSIWGRRFRYFSSSWVLDEIERLVDTYGAKGIYFREDNFTINSKRVTDICNGILERHLDLVWVCESRVDLVYPKLLEKMKKAYCETIWFGAESGSQRVLNLINKGITVEQTKKAVNMCRKTKIKVGLSFMIGIPGETMEDMKKTLKLAKELDPDYCWFNIFIGIPFSPLYNQIVERKQYSHIDEAFLVYVKTEEFDYDLIRGIQEMFEREYVRAKVLKPSYIARKLLNIRSPLEAFRLVRDFTRILS